MTYTVKTLRLPLSIIIFCVCTTSAFSQIIDLYTERGGISNDGRVKLIWSEAPEETTYIIQQAKDESFTEVKTIYEGPDRASFVSGLKDGTYFFRVKPSGGSWSETLTVQVQHHSLQLALILFGVGAIVFLLTALVVLKGSVQTSTQKS